jgi:hypothetical protein
MSGRPILQLYTTVGEFEALHERHDRTRSTSKTVTVDRQRSSTFSWTMPACSKLCARQVGSMSPNRIEAAGLRRRGAARGRGRGGFRRVWRFEERPRAARQGDPDHGKKRHSEDRNEPLGEHRLRQACLVAGKCPSSKDGVTIEQLAADIGRRKLLQSLNVRPVLDGDGEETGTFEVPAGGRRYLALGILVKQKRLAKNEPIPASSTAAERRRPKKTRSPRTSIARTCIRSTSSARSRR